MFSMKYTSPKVTPKKGALLDTSLSPPSFDRAGSASALRGDGGNAAEDTSCGNRSIHAVYGEGSGYGGLDLKLSKRNNGASPSSSDLVATKRTAAAASSKESSILSDNHDSENDSAVANVSEDIMEPRSNLLALLDREYASGSGSGEGSSMKFLPVSSDDKTSPILDDGSAEPAVTNGCIQEENITALDDEDMEENGDGDALKDAIDDANNLHSTKHLSSNLPKEYYLHEIEEENFDYTSYRRSASMEPLFDVQREELNDSIPTTLSVGEGESVEVTPIAGLGGSLLSSSGSVEVATNDSQEMSPKLDRETSKDANPSSPIIYDMSEQPSSPFMSEVNGDRGGDEPIRADFTTASEVTESEVGGDAYFDGPASCVDEVKPRADSIDDDLVHVTLPPRVNRTTSNGPVPGNAPFLPGCPSPSRAAPGKTPCPNHSSFPLSPRQPFSHTHSLLDDCSDEEEETASCAFVDSPTRQHSYSCLPRPRTNSNGSSPFSTYFKKQKSNRKRQISAQSGDRATQVANNNIQQVLLQTRHRRWDCQMAYAGSHAQSNQVFDVSNRCHYIVGYVPESDDCEYMTRLSVSVEAIRAAALASGLWRTVRLVRLPKGLFSSYTYDMKRRKDGDDIWALLKMLSSTFPTMDQIDFGGDISTATNTSDDWRNEVLAFIMECLPNIVAIDGFVVEQEVFEAESHCSEKSPTSIGGGDDRQQDDLDTYSRPHISQKATNTFDAAENSAACVDCETVPPMCGFEDLVESDAMYGQWNTATSSIGDEDVNDMSLVTEFGTGEINKLSGPSFAGEILSDIEEDAPENIVSTEEQNEHEALAIKCSGSQESINDDVKNTSALSSQSWGSNNSGTRPPTCPNSTPRSRLPAKPDRKKGKVSFTKSGSRLKRRVLGLIPSVSMMDEDEDEESDDSEECPTDLL